MRTQINKDELRNRPLECFMCQAPALITWQPADPDIRDRIARNFTIPMCRDHFHTILDVIDEASLAMDREWEEARVAKERETDGDTDDDPHGR